MKWSRKPSNFAGSALLHSSHESWHSAMRVSAASSAAEAGWMANTVSNAAIDVSDFMMLNPNSSSRREQAMRLSYTRCYRSGSSQTEVTFDHEDKETPRAV